MKGLSVFVCFLHVLFSRFLGKSMSLGCLNESVMTKSSVKAAVDHWMLPTVTKKLLRRLETHNKKLQKAEWKYTYTKLLGKRRS